MVNFARTSKVEPDLKKILTYQPLLTSFIYLLLVGQLWVNVASHCHWFSDSKSDMIEFCDYEGEESEEEEKDDKIGVELFALKIDATSASVKILSPEDFPPINPTESIPHPPPEIIQS